MKGIRIVMSFYQTVRLGSLRGRLRWSLVPNESKNFILQGKPSPLPFAKIGAPLYRAARMVLIITSSLLHRMQLFERARKDGDFESRSECFYSLAKPHILKRQRNEFPFRPTDLVEAWEVILALSLRL